MDPRNSTRTNTTRAKRKNCGKLLGLFKALSHYFRMAAAAEICARARFLRSERLGAAALRRDTGPLAQLLGDPDPVSGPADRRRARRGRPPGQRRGRAARRRRDRAVHRQVPQGGHRRARRRAAAHARGAAALPARTRRAPGRDPHGDRRPGQADRRARSPDPGRRLQGPAGGPLPALQAEAAHQGADRPRGGPGAAGRPAARATRPTTRRRAAADFVDPDRDVPDAGRRPGRRPRHPGRAVRRGRGPARASCASRWPPAAR